MISIRKLFGALALAALFCSSAFGLQVVDGVPGHNSHIKISRNELTSIVVERAKIKTLLFTEGELAIEPDREQGIVFVRPLVFDKPINVRVLVVGGGTYNLILQVEDIPQEDVVIRQPFAAADARQTADVPASALPGRIKALVTGMASEEAPTAFDYRARNQEIALWEGTRFVLLGTYSSRGLVGEKYKLTNTGKATVRMVEQEFYRKGVFAIAVENMQLEPGQATHVYVVRGDL